MTEQKVYLSMNTGVHTSQIYDFCVTSDGSHLVSFGADKTIRIWDPIAQREVRQIRGQISRGLGGDINSIALTPDDQYLLVAARSTKNIEQYLLRVFNFKTGEMLRSIGTWGAISSIRFTQDKKFMILSDYTLKKAEIYDYQKFINTLDKSALRHTITYPSNPLQMQVFQMGTKYRIVSSLWELVHNQHALQIHEFDKDFANVKLIKNIPSPDSGPESISVNSQHIVYNYHTKKQITIIDYDGNPVTEIEAPYHSHTLKHSPDGTMLLAGYKGENGACIIYTANDGYKPLTQFFSHKSTCQATAFLNNQTAVTGGGSKNEIFFWYPHTGEIRGHIFGKGQTVFGVGMHKNLIAFGNTQHFKTDANNYAPLEQVVDLDNFEIYDINNFDELQFTRVKPNYNNKKLEVRDANLWLNQVPLTGIKIAQKDIWYFAETFGFTEDGLIVTGQRTGGLVFICQVDESKGWGGATYLACLRGHTGDVWDMAIEGNRLITCGVDQTIRFWNLDEVPRPKTDNELASFKQIFPTEAHTIEPFLTMFFTDDGEWIIWSKSGFYDSSLNGDKYVGFHVNCGEDKVAEFYSSDRFAHTLFRPDIIRKIIETGNEETVLNELGLTHIDVEDILPPKIIFNGNLKQSTDQATFSFEFSVENPQKKPLTRVWILADDRPVWEQDITSNNNGPFKVKDLPLFSGLNILKVMARTNVSQSNPLFIEVFSQFDEINYKSHGATSGNSQTNFKKITPNLYLLAIGVSKYKYGKNLAPGKKPESGVLYNLTYSHKDAQEIVTNFKNYAKNIYQVIPTCLTDEKATKGKIIEEVKALKTKLDKRFKEKQQKKQVAKDVVIVFMSGHGVQIGSEFFFMCYDAKPGSVKTTGLKMIEIGKIINDFKAEIVLLTDACHSGQIGQNFNNRELTKTWQDINGRAQVIFNATTADNVAIELSSLKHGVFSNGIVNVLKSERVLSMFQFFLNVSNYVRFTTKPKEGQKHKMQKPTLSILGSITDFTIAKK